MPGSVPVAEEIISHAVASCRDKDKVWTDQHSCHLFVRLDTDPEVHTGPRCSRAGPDPGSAFVQPREYYQAIIKHLATEPVLHISADIQTDNSRFSGAESG